MNQTSHINVETCNRKTSAIKPAILLCLTCLLVATTCPWLIDQLVSLEIPLSSFLLEILRLEFCACFQMINFLSKESTHSALIMSNNALMLLVLVKWYYSLLEEIEGNCTPSTCRMCQKNQKKLIKFTSEFILTVKCQFC